MSSRLYVENLSVEATKDELHTLFSTVGTVKLVVLPTDHQTGGRQLYAFVEMETTEQAAKAIASLNGHAVRDRAIKVTAIDGPMERQSPHSEDGGFRQQKRGGWKSSGDPK